METNHNFPVSPLHIFKYPDINIDPNSNRIDEFLKPIEELPLDSDSDYSEITDIFEEFHKESFLRTNAVPEKRHLSKTEADWKTVEQFTDEFKKVMRKVREELQTKPSLFEEEEEVEKVLNNPLVSKELKTSRPTSPIPVEQQDVSEVSSESLIWQRLLKNSEGRFKVSPPIFDVFRQEEKHWSERPPVSWKVLDKCRVKCEKWLEDTMQVGEK